MARALRRSLPSITPPPPPPPPSLPPLPLTTLGHKKCTSATQPWTVARHELSPSSRRCPALEARLLVPDFSPRPRPGGVPLCRTRDARCVGQAGRCCSGGSRGHALFRSDPPASLLVCSPHLSTPPRAGNSPALKLASQGLGPAWSARTHAKTPSPSRRGGAGCGAPVLVEPLRTRRRWCRPGRRRSRPKHMRGGECRGLQQQQPRP